MPRQAKTRRQPAAGPALLVAGGLFAAYALLDPAFDALAVVLGRGVPVSQVAAGQAVWVLISQAPLIGVLAVAVFGSHRGSASWFQQRWNHWKPWVSSTVTMFLTVAAATLALDSVWYLTMGTFLLPRP